MASFFESLSTAFSISLSHLMNIPMGILSAKGLADSTGFVVLAMINNAITPSIKETARNLPMGYYLRSLVDGAVMKANFLYGTATS